MRGATNAPREPLRKRVPSFVAHANVTPFHRIARAQVETLRMRYGWRQVLALATIASLTLLGCAREADKPVLAAVVPPPDAGSTSVALTQMHSDAPGIAWFNGDVDAAFKSAR